MSKNWTEMLKVVVLFPIILLVWLGAKQDPHLFRYWDVHSLRHWRESKFDWKAWAIAVIAWGVLVCAAVGIFLLVRRWM